MHLRGTAPYPFLAIIITQARHFPNFSPVLVYPLLLCSPLESVRNNRVFPRRI